MKHRSRGEAVTPVMCLAVFNSPYFEDKAELSLNARLRGLWILSGVVWHSYKRVQIFEEQKRLFCVHLLTGVNRKASLLILPNMSVPASLHSLMPVVFKSLPLSC